MADEVLRLGGASLVKPGSVAGILDRTAGDEPRGLGFGSLAVRATSFRGVTGLVAGSDTMRLTAGIKTGLIFWPSDACTGLVVIEPGSLGPGILDRVGTDGFWSAPDTWAGCPSAGRVEN